MSSESHKTHKEREFGGGDKESLNKRALCSPDTPKLGESTFAAYTDCDDLIRSDMRRTQSCVGYDDMQQSEVPKFRERISHDNLERLYICKVDERKLNIARKICSEEQPLDFSRKPISSVRKDEFPQKFRKLGFNPTKTSQGSEENSANSSDCLDDSCDDEEKPERFTLYSHANGTRAPRVAFHTNGSGSTVYNEREDKLHKMNNRRFVQCARRKEYKLNGLKAANSSGSEDEFHSQYSVHNSRSYEQNGDHSQLESSYTVHLSAEGKKSPYSQHTISEMPHVSNRNSENDANISREKNDRFHIQDILSRDSQSAPKEEHLETAHQINNSITQQKTSPQSTFNHFGKEENLPPGSISPSHTVNIPTGSASLSPSLKLPLGSSSPSHSVNLPFGYTSPGHAVHLPLSRFPFGATDRLHESSTMISPYAFPPIRIGNFMNHNSPGEAPDSSRLYSYPPGAMFQPTFNPMYAQPYQQGLVVSHDQQRQKKQRPFKDIDTSFLMKHLPITQTAAALNLGPSPSSAYNSTTIKYTECNGSTAMDSSPQRLSPDSPCIVNGSSGNESSQQDTNESGRKKIRRIPPEEKDEKYLEKRRKNNLAAKKSRDQRRNKEDILAMGCQELFDLKLELETRNKVLSENFAIKEQKLDMVIGNLISFREKCEGRTKELFEETFKLFLPQQI
ncbi:hypothetical protein AVEN_222674-1 [Araneus ventricosus]|uniref:BZIP domain-containing protein n=1 Tax=Araneus ventricosus TaxID=182803 RepID=A0A4Y2B008_ARAVE|nr:hypothetical protein AVEN_222674-1 [Araneus ventricosus]